MLVSLGTLNWHNGGRFFTAAAEAIGGMDAHGIVVAPPELVAALPNVLAVPTCPSWRCCRSAVVCHGGHNTVCEALAHGLPLVWPDPRRPAGHRRPGGGGRGGRPSCSAGPDRTRCGLWPPPSAIRGCGPAPSGPAVVRRGRSGGGDELERRRPVLHGNRVQHLRPDEVASGGWRSG